MRTAVDVDDVLFPWTRYAFLWHNERYGTSLTENDRTSFYLEHVWRQHEDEVVRRVGEFYDKVDLMQISPIRGAQRVIDALRVRKELVVVSARFSRHKDITRSWIERHFPGCFSQIELTSFREPGTRSKSEVCVALGVDRLIDDHLDNLAECGEHGISGVLFGEYPWNRVQVLPPSIIQARDWGHVADLMRTW